MTDLERIERQMEVNKLRKELSSYQFKTGLAKENNGETETAQAIAHKIVREYEELKYKSEDVPGFQVLTVWWSKTLQNWKGMFITTLPDLKYYEVIYNGDKRQSYLDCYEKLENVVAANEKVV